MPEAFFLNGAAAPLFTLHWPGSTACAPVLLLPPLLEELNKSRRALNELARALQAQGHAVLLVDWFGTGDSGGDLADASWSQWQADVAHARAFLAERYPMPPVACALRGGALLLPELPDCNWLLCAPISDGQQQLTQWLRLKLMAARMVGDNLSSEQLMAQIDAGGVEIAGYFLPPALITPMRSIRLADAVSSGNWRHLIEVGSQQTPTPASKTLLARWQASWAAAAGEAFWQTTEIAVCPALVAAVCQQLRAPAPAYVEPVADAGAPA